MVSLLQVFFEIFKQLPRQHGTSAKDTRVQHGTRTDTIRHEQRRLATSALVHDGRGRVLAASAAGPRLLDGELAVGLAEREGRADAAEDDLAAAALVEVEALGDAAADEAREERREDVGADGVAEAALVGLRVLGVRGVALARDLAGPADDDVEAARRVLRAVADAAGVAHGFGGVL